jgi:small multidrug resistance family-3 protein
MNENNETNISMNNNEQSQNAVVLSNNNTTGINNDNNNDNESTFHWTATTIIQALVLFVIAGIAEIGGGYLVWKAIRGDLSTNRKKWIFATIGSLVLILYGFIPTLQPTDSFGRIYAVYGGFFIVLSFLAGWWLDGDKPDLGDVIGGSISLVGVLLILFWPRT